MTAPQLLSVRDGDVLLLVGTARGAFLFRSDRSRRRWEKSGPHFPERSVPLEDAFPGVVRRVLDERGEVRPHVNLFVGEECVRFGDGLSTPLPKGCEIAILPAVSGG